MLWRTKTNVTNCDIFCVRRMESYLGKEKSDSLAWNWIMSATRHNFYLHSRQEWASYQFILYYLCAYDLKLNVLRICLCHDIVKYEHNRARFITTRKVKISKRQGLIYPKLKDLKNVHVFTCLFSFVVVLQWITITEIYGNYKYVFADYMNVYYFLNLCKSTIPLSFRRYKNDYQAYFWWSAKIYPLITK